MKINIINSVKKFRVINFCSSQQLFSGIIQKPMEKSYWVFVEGNYRVMQTSGQPINICHICHSMALSQLAHLMCTSLSNIIWCLIIVLHK